MAEARQNEVSASATKKPLFYGGKDIIANLEIVDIDVDWTLAALLIRKAKGMPTGTAVKSIKLGD